jgi:hypothetical protein
MNKLTQEDIQEIRNQIAGEETNYAVIYYDEGEWWMRAFVEEGEAKGFKAEMDDKCIKTFLVKNYYKAEILED